MDLFAAIMNLFFAIILMALVIHWLVNDEHDDPDQTFHAQVDELHKAVRRLWDTIVAALRGRQ